MPFELEVTFVEKPVSRFVAVTVTLLCAVVPLRTRPLTMVRSCLLTDGG